MCIRRFDRDHIGTSLQFQVTRTLHLTLYSIHRDHSVKSGLFNVDVPEAGERGIGFQLRTWPVEKGWQLFGISLIRETLG